MSKKNSNVLNLKKHLKENNLFASIYKIFKLNLKTINSKNLLVAVSGGPDSLALAALTKLLNLEKNKKIFYVLVDHKIRKESSKEAKSVKKLLKKFEINLVVIQNNELINKNVQGKAREIRYKLLSDFCRKKKIKHIITAHNSEDQVETFFIRLSRGSGIQGLSSMKKISKLSSNVKLLRPLLSIRKKQLESISKKIFGKVFRDPSNKDKKYLRTRIRQLNKYLTKSGINQEQILRSIKNLASTNETLNFFINKVYESCIKKDKNKIILNYKLFLSETSEIQMKVLSKAIKNFSNSYYPPRSIKVLNLLNGLRKFNQKQFTLSGCLISRDDKFVTIKKEPKLVIS